MTKGLDLLLAKIKATPNDLLIGRYLALIAELSEEQGKSAFALDLAAVLVDAKAGEALKIAYMVHKSDPGSARAYDVMIAALTARGRLAKAEMLRMEKAKWLTGGGDSPGTGIDALDLAEDGLSAATTVLVKDWKAASPATESWQTAADGDGEALRVPLRLLDLAASESDTPLTFQPTVKPVPPPLAPGTEEVIFAPSFRLTDEDAPSATPAPAVSRFAATVGSSAPERVFALDQMSAQNLTTPNAQPLLVFSDDAAAQTKVSALASGAALASEAPASLGTAEAAVGDASAFALSLATSDQPISGLAEVPLTGTAFWTPVHGAVGRLARQYGEGAADGASPSHLAAQPGSPPASAQAPITASFWPALKALASELQAEAGGEGQDQVIGKLWELCSAVFGEQPDPGLVTFLEELGLQHKQPGFWGLYLDALIARSSHRKALADVRQQLELMPQLPWARVAMRRLPQLWAALGVRGFVWREEDGMALLRTLLAKRPQPTMSCLVV